MWERRGCKPRGRLCYAAPMDRSRSSTPGWKTSLARMGEELGARSIAAWRWAEGALEELRGRGRIFRLRLAVLSGWALLSTLSLLVAFSTPRSPGVNALRAYVAVKETSMSWALLVHNRSEAPWHGVEILLDGGHSFRRERIDPDEKLVLSPGQFSLDGALRLEERPPRSVKILAAEGAVTPVLAEE